jgi:hypothetical protein
MMTALPMGIGYVIGATPAVESASLRLKLFNFFEGARIEVTQSNFEAIAHL